jgi:hypothetical protein
MAALTVLAALAVRGFGAGKFAAVSIRDYRFSVFNKRTLLFSAFLVLVALHWGTELTVYGPGRALHSGHYGNWAPNPAVELAHLVAGLRDRDGRIQVAGWSDEVR